MKLLRFLGLVALAAATLHGQQFWSLDPNLNCNGSNNYGATIRGVNIGPPPVPNAGTAAAYVCRVGGTVPWYAAGAGWHSSIRVAAPWGAPPIRATYTFTDQGGSSYALETATNGGTVATASGKQVQAVLKPNQPLEVNLLGSAGDGPDYPTSANGSVYVSIDCPDLKTCTYVNPQLIYSALPSQPWSLSVPIAWDGSEDYTWMAEGINDPSTKSVLSLAISNAGSTDATYTVQVYDSNGNLAGSATTQSISSAQAGRGTGGVQGFLLGNLIPNLPTGILKVVVSGSGPSNVMVLQFKGPSATTLQVAYDATPGSSATPSSARRADLK